MAGRLVRPLILVRGFGGADVSDEASSPYQGFNNGTVYPGRRGDNYIYEGFLLRALKSVDYPYRDATNVVGYYADEVPPPPRWDDLPEDLVRGTVVLDPATQKRVLSAGVAGTIWVYRYYDLRPRALQRYGEGLGRLIRLIQASADRRDEPFAGVDVVAHSMGGLVVREAVKAMHRTERGSARRLVHRVVTLGTPHRGIAFQRLPSWLLRALPKVNDAADELAAFDPEHTTFLEWEKFFDVGRVLTIVGTNHRTYATAPSLANRVAGLLDEGTLAYSRSDGLVRQAAAQLPGAPRTFVHKCHGGLDSLVTSREAYEIAMRFLHGTHKVSLWLHEAKISRGEDWFGKSEFYFGVSIKPRYVDFELVHQSPEAENCYGPFAKTDLSDDLPDLADELRKPLAAHGDKTTSWAGPNRLIWQGWIDGGAKPDDAKGLVFRIDVYVGERDTFGIGFSDNVVFRKQYYIQAFPGDPVELFIHTGEEHLRDNNPTGAERLRQIAQASPSAPVQRPQRIDVADSETAETWAFRIQGTGFTATFHLGLEPAAD